MSVSCATNTLRNFSMCFVDSNTPGRGHPQNKCPPVVEHRGCLFGERPIMRVLLDIKHL
jgi:hypothetical protein